jgi:hypothetical protein
MIFVYLKIKAVDNTTMYIIVVYECQKCLVDRWWWWTMHICVDRFAIRIKQKSEEEDEIIKKKKRWKYGWWQNEQ